MTDESLAAYLAERIDGDADKARALISAFDIPDETKNDKKYLNAVVDKLSEIKILDPACGSGAFPMGLLNRIVEIISKIKPDIDRYDLKLNLIENCIYGVDIQTIAIQISKLRFFIALVSEQEKTTKKSENYGIRPLPNLETKFVAANTLVSLNQGVSNELNFPDDKLEKFKDELRQIRSHDMIKVSSYKQKKELRKKDETLCNSIEVFVSGNLGKPNEEEIKQWQSEIARLEKEKMKYAGEKFEEIVSRNATLFGDDGPKIPLRIDVNKEKRKELDKSIKYYQSKIYFERSKTASNAQQSEVRKLIRWNPYKPTDSADFFDAQWMFSMKDGFDIVIGNPPYVQLKKFRWNPIQEVYRAQNYFSHDSMGDLYQLFYERGLDLLRDGGHLCYITSNKWLRTGSGEKSRELFSTKYNPKLLLDLGGKIFKSATVDTNILLIEKSSNYGTTWAWSRKKDDDIEKMSDLIRQQGQAIKFGAGAWVILNPIEQSIKAKIEKLGTPLKDWDISINYGIKTGCNEAFIISAEKRTELIAKDAKSAEIIRPILRGRDIKRYGFDWSADLYLIAAHNGYKGEPRIDINKYLAIKDWLDKGGVAYNGKIYKGYEQLAKREDQGDTPYNLRSCVYMDDFSRPKIIYPNMTKYMPFIFDIEGFMTNQKCFIITGENIAFLTAFLNSSLFKFCFRDNFPELQGGTRELSKIFFDKVQVLQTDSKTNLQFEKLITQVQSAVEEKRETKAMELEIDNLIFDLYRLSQKEKDAIGFVEIK
jgi:tRNA1(Val) A37 N6-methylase TrmN6